MILYRIFPLQESSFSGIILFRNYPLQELLVSESILFRNDPFQELSFSGNVFPKTFSTQKRFGDFPFSSFFLKRR